MTTDTKGVARWDIGYVGGLDDEARMIENASGRYVRFIDHEQVVAELDQRVIVAEEEYVKQDREIHTLRSALAAKSAEVEGLVNSFSEVNIEECLRAFNDVLTPALRVPYTMAFRIAMTAAISVAMEKSNEHQDQ